MKVRDLRIKEKFFIDDKYLNGYAKKCGWKATLVYLSLCRHADKKQLCFPSIEKMAEEHDISERTIRRGIKDLERWNIVRVERTYDKKTKRYLNNTYFLLDKTEWKSKNTTQRTRRHVEKRVSTKGKSETQRSVSHNPAVCESQTQRSVSPHKDTHNKDTHSKDISCNEVAGSDINLLISLFEEINPSFERLFRNKTQRGSASRMIKKFGLEKMKKLVESLPSILSKKYAPTITTPHQLEQKLGQLKLFIDKEKKKGGGLPVYRTK